MALSIILGPCTRSSWDLGPGLQDRDRPGDTCVEFGRAGTKGYRNARNALKVVLEAAYDCLVGTYNDNVSCT